MPRTATFPPSYDHFNTSAAGHECLFNPESLLNLPPQLSAVIGFSRDHCSKSSMLFTILLTFEHAISIYLANSNFAKSIVVNVINMGLTLVR